MNKTRMKKIARIADKLRDIRGELENVLIEETDFRDGIKTLTRNGLRKPVKSLLTPWNMLKTLSLALKTA